MQQNGPKELGFFGTRNMGWMHQQLIEVLSYAMVLTVRTSSTSGWCMSPSEMAVAVPLARRRHGRQCLVTPAQDSSPVRSGPYGILAWCMHISISKQTPRDKVA